MPSNAAGSVLLLRGVHGLGQAVRLGLTGSLVLGRALSGLLYGLSPADPVGLGSAAAVLLAVAALACFLPAWRASRVDPLRALREG